MIRAVEIKNLDAVYLSFTMKKLSYLLSFVLIIGMAFLAKSYFCSPVRAFCDQPTSATSHGEINQLAPRYLEYSKEALAYAHRQGKVILYFWAPWCATCSNLDTDIQKNPSLIPEGYTFLRINYDHSPELKSTYHVVTQHTFVLIDDNGNALSSWVGGDETVWKQHLVW